MLRTLLFTDNEAEERNVKTSDYKGISINENVEDISVEESQPNDDQVTKNEDKIQILIGAAVGAGVVISILLCILIGYRLYAKRRRRKSKKYKSSVVSGHQRGIQSQVTLLPIQSVQSLRNNPRMNNQGPPLRLPSSQNYLRSPPPYHESMLNNSNSFRNNL